MKTNKGYTLIEMIIVIAIMAILTAATFVTIGVIKEAKCNAAVNTIENQLSALWVKTKALSQGTVQSDPNIPGDAASTFPLCMQIVKNSDASDDVKDGSYEIILGYTNGASGFMRKEVVATISDIVSIKYTEPAGHSEQRHSRLTTATSGDSTSAMFIQFDKSDGSVKYGAGTYEIIYNGRSFGTIYLDRVTGSHYIK